MKSAISDQVVKSPVTAPATASGPYQVRNRRSTNTWTVNDIWLRISGYATASTSRPPPSPRQNALNRTDQDMAAHYIGSRRGPS